MTTRAAAAEVTRERIGESALTAFTTRWYDDVTLRDIAADAEVAVQTVVNHFGSKEELFADAMDRFGRSIADVRHAVARGDLDGAVTAVVDDYERTGDAVLRLLALEERIPVIRPVVARGRAEHEAWLEHVLGDALRGRRGAERRRRLAQLVVAMDVYTWKLLRRDKGLTRAQTITAMQELVQALYDNDDARGEPE